jgi:hypothetical protein
MQQNQRRQSTRCREMVHVGFIQWSHCSPDNTLEQAAALGSGQAPSICDTKAAATTIPASYGLGKARAIAYLFRYYG